MTDQTHKRDDDEKTELPSKTAASIHIENLGKTFETRGGEEVVFTDIDIEVEAGSFVSLLGKSGSGKSTILDIVSDILEPTAGRVRFEKDGEEEDVTIGHIFQSPRLLPWDTCLQNIELVHEDNEEYDDEVGKYYLDMVDLSEHYDKYPTQLSGGQRQRVGIARALSIDPEVLLMDEPFSALDEITADALRDQLLDIWQELGKTVFFVTHDIDEAIEMSDRLLMLGDGEIYADLEVPLERPRDIQSAEFVQFRKEAIEAFHSLGRP